MDNNSLSSGAGEERIINGDVPPSEMQTMATQHPDSLSQPAKETQEAEPSTHHRQLDVKELQAIMSFTNFDIAKLVEQMENNDDVICRQRKRGFNHQMRSELKRLKTFESFNRFATWSPEEMASVGFYYTGLKMSVQCFCCGGVFCSTSITKSARSEHQKFEPDCGFVKTLDVGNISKYAVRVQIPEDVPLSRVEQLKEQQARLETFKGWPFYVKMEPDLLAKVGFFFTGIKDKVQCFSCGGSLANWEEDDDPWKEHSKWFPECEFVQSEKSAADIGQYKRSYAGFRGITAAHFTNMVSSTVDAYTSQSRSEGSFSRKGLECIRNIFGDEKVRLESFHTWPPDISVSPASLAEAGFFYRGFGDNTQCFCCGVQLCKWEDGDDPWKEHKRHSSDCPYLLRRGNADDGDVDREKQQLKELSFTAMAEEARMTRETEGSVGGEVPSNENNWIQTAERMSRYLRKLYGSSTFSKVFFGESVSIDLRLIYAELHLVLKNIKDQALQTVALAELLRGLDRVTVVEGEVGSGKSALLRKVAILWASGHCPVLDRFKLVLHLSLRSIRRGQGAADAIKHQLLAPDFMLSDSSFKEVIYRLGNQALILLDDYGEVDSEVPLFIEEELIHKNHLSNVAIILGLRTNRAASVRQFANAIISIREFPLYSTIDILKTLFSHDIPRLQKLVYQLGWSETLKGVLKTPLFALAVCRMWVQFPQEDSFHCLAIFKAFLGYIVQKHRQGGKGEAAVSCCGQLALTGVLESRFEFVDEDLSQAGVDAEDALRLGLLSKFTAQRLKPVYRFFHATYQEYLAGKRLSELLASDVTDLQDKGLDYLSRIDTFLKFFTRYYFFLRYAAGSSARAASQIVSHLLDMTQRTSSFASQADGSNYLELHPEFAFTETFFIQLSQVLHPEEYFDQVIERVLEFALRCAADNQAIAEIASLILKFLKGKPLAFATSALGPRNMLGFIKMYPETLSIVSHLQLLISGKKNTTSLSYSEMAECMGSFGAPNVEEEYVAAFQSLSTTMEKNKKHEEEINNFSCLISKHISPSFMVPFVLLPERYKTPKLKLTISQIDTLQEGDLESLSTLCALSEHIALTLRDSHGVLGEMEPVVELHRERFKALMVHQNRLSEEEQDLVSSMCMLESLELSFNDGQCPEYLLSCLEKLCHLKELKIEVRHPQRIIDQIPEGFANLHNIEKLVFSGISLVEDSSKLARFLRNFPSLRIFHLSCNSCPEFGELINALTSCSHLEELVLRGFHLCPTETSSFAASLSKFEHLKILDIPYHEFSHTEQSDAFARALASLVNLEELYLCRSAGSIAVAPPLTHRLQDMRRLKVLTINKGLDEESLVKLAKVAKSGHLSRLEILNLNMNDNLSDLGWRDFFLILGNMDELRELYISRLYTNQLRPQPDTFKAFVQCVSRLPALVTVQMFSWMLDTMDFNMFNAMKENHPQSRRLHLMWQWLLPFTPIVQTEG